VRTFLNLFLSRCVEVLYQLKYVSDSFVFSDVTVNTGFHSVEGMGSYRLDNNEILKHEHFFLVNVGMK